MFAFCRASRLVVCSLAILLLAGACVPIPSSTPSLSTPAAAPSDRLVFASRGGGGSAGLYVVDLPPSGAVPGGLQPGQLTSDAGYWPVVSPDGGWIAYVIEKAGAAGTPPQRDIWLVSMDGQKQFNMTQNPASNIEPSWSPDTSQIAFSSTRAGDGYTNSIWIQDVAPILAGDAPAPRKLVDIGSSPRWSPDGTQIAYLAAKDGGNFTQLYTIKPDGTGERQLTAHQTDGNGSGMGVPAWQPDGRWMMVPMDFGPKRQLVLLPVVGTTAPVPDSDVKIVTPGEEYADGPAWEADGRWVAFFGGRNENQSIRVMDMQSGEVRRIAPELAGMYPAWSRDGSRLAFMVQGPAPDYNLDIFVTSRDGSNLFNVTSSPTPEINPAWIPPNQPAK